MDLFGPVETPSVGGKKYTLVMVDDYSRYTWAIFLSKKNETLQKFPSLLKQLQTEKNMKVRTIRSDRGTSVIKMQSFINSLTKVRVIKRNQQQLCFFETSFHRINKILTGSKATSTSAADYTGLRRNSTVSSTQPHHCSFG
ncbi:unnamed protein product [Cuscuta europaea]|uniref:Integrase catalytic domain-containing protein n=1 Tax=Cuscuta europaea TaxID=41803 RepID=A0A9P0VW00_CUSEU|nr:unnamed protein product [Cuscuta europaea]